MRPTGKQQMNNTRLLLMNNTRLLLMNNTRLLLIQMHGEPLRDPIVFRPAARPLPAGRKEGRKEGKTVDISTNKSWKLPQSVFLGFRLETVLLPVH
jgi:hypothetical protein